MIDIKNKVDCCGCNACGDICPTKAISFDTDIEGFWYPMVDLDKCINCGLCERTCPNLNIVKLKHNDFPRPQKSIASINKNMEVRWNSTSGGAFSAFADHIFSQGGFVGGAVYNDKFTVNQILTDDPEKLSELRSSKYLESNAEGFYKRVRETLLTGKKVLVCGTPCQMAGLRAFLNKDYENLIIIDFICRGVNSPKVYRKYLDSLEAKYGSKVAKVKAKNKELGWRNLTRKVTFENGESYYGVLMEDDFRRGYHTNVFCRPSCYECVFKGFPRMSDITIGDFWGIEKYDQNLDNNIGTSMVLLNSKKGESFWNEVKASFEHIELPLETAFKGNVALFHPIELAKINRKEFFDDLDTGTFDDVVAKYFPKGKPLHKGIKSKIKDIIFPVYDKVRYIGLSPKAIYKFLKINLRKNTKASFKGNKLIFPKPYTVFDIHPSAKINVDRGIVFGNNPVRGMKMPTCLKMTANTTLNLTEGRIDRYEDSPYNLRYGAYIEVVNGGTLTISKGAANVGLTIMCAKEVTIGSGVRIGRNVSIRDWNGGHVIVTPAYRNHAPVHIEDHVWLCTGCTIMPGVTVGEGSVVAANATVTKDVPPHSLVGGSPAKVIRHNIEWY